MANTNTASGSRSPEATPYLAASAYWRAGFVNPIPVLGKTPPIEGYTGRDGANVSYSDITTWVGTHAGQNIGIRHANTVGIDVDGELGADSVRCAEQQLGQLPKTWSVTARGPGQPRRTYIYRLPGLVDMSRSEGRFRKQFGPQVDIIHRGHRYSIVWPSVHPETGTVYRWYDTDGTQVGDRVLPNAKLLPELPREWIEYLRARDEPAEPVAVAPDADDPFVTTGRTFTMDQARAYCMPALDRFAAMRTPQDYGFNTALNELAVRFGHFVPAFMSDAAAAGAIWKAAERNRSVEYQGKNHVLATIHSGMVRGMTEPYVRVEGSAEPVENVTSAGLAAEFLTATQLQEMPNPEPLVNGVLDMDTTSWLIGRAGSYKSFVALDLLGHVALGKPWHGHQVRQGRGVYIVAEGVRGTKLRVAAFERTYGALGDQVVFLPRPVQVRDAGAWKSLVEAVASFEPVLVVIDTQSRVTLGLKENDNSEMMYYVHGVDAIRTATSACVLTLHHQGRAGLDARGASSIDGAQDTELRIERDMDRHVLIHLDKMKDADDSEVIDLDLLRSEGGTDMKTGRDLSSLIVVTGSLTNRRIVKDWIDNLVPNQSVLVGVFADFVPHVGGTKAEVRRLVMDRLPEESKMAGSSFARAWDGLVTKGVIERVGTSQRWVLTSMTPD